VLRARAKLTLGAGAGGADIALLRATTDHLTGPLTAHLEARLRPQPRRQMRWQLELQLQCHMPYQIGCNLQLLLILHLIAQMNVLMKDQVI